MKLTSIRIDGMHKIENTTYNLSNFNYFVGPNGAGKTTILQAIQLALLGYIPGTNKTKEAVFRHSNGMHMIVELTAVDGPEVISIKRYWTRSNKEIISNVEIVPKDYDIKSIIEKLELPVFNFTDFINMTANKLKDWFIDFLPASDTSIDWKAELYKSTKAFAKVLDTDFIEDQIKTVEAMPYSGLDQIRQFNAELKSMLSYKKGEIARVQNTIQSLIFYEDVDSGDVAAIKQTNAELNTLKDKLTEQIILIEQDAKTQQSIDALDLFTDEEASAKKYHADMDSLAQTLNLISHIKEVIRELSEERYQKQSDLQSLAKLISSDGKCPYTAEACASIASSVDSAKIQKVELLDSLNQLHIDIAAKDDEYKALCTKERHTKSQIERFQVQQTTYNNLVKSLHPEIRGLSQSDLINQKAEVENTILANNNTIIKLEANKKYQQLTDQLTKEKYRLEENVEMLKLWVKLTDVNGLQSSIMNKPFEILGDTISAYLIKFFKREDISAKFILSEKSNTFSFGVSYSNGDYIEYDLLSSGEKCLFTLAMLLSLVESSRCKLPLVMIDDLLDHLDENHSKALFDSLYNIADIQVLLAGVSLSPYNQENAKEFIIEV